MANREKPLTPQPPRKDPYEGCPTAVLIRAESGGWFLRGESLETEVFVSLAELSAWARENRVKIIPRGLTVS